MPGKELMRLFVAHRRGLQAYLTDLLRDADTAADLTQETFLRMAEQGGGTGAAGILHGRAYLYRTARNLAIDHVRRLVRQRTDATAHDALAHIADQRPGQEEAAAARQDLARLRALVDELPDRTRAVFLLVRVDGLSYQDAARHLGISESAVQKHLAKALTHVTKRRRQP